MSRTLAFSSTSKESNTSRVNPPGLGVAPDLSGSGDAPDVFMVLEEGRVLPSSPIGLSAVGTAQIHR